MKQTDNTGGVMTHTAVFRITESQYQEFTTLLDRVPGSDVGAMYREVFARGLLSLKAFSEEHDLLTREEVAAELGHEQEAEDDLAK